MTRRAAVPLEDQTAFVPAPNTTPLVMELDPESPPADEEEKDEAA